MFNQLVRSLNFIYRCGYVIKEGIWCRIHSNPASLTNFVKSIAKMDNFNLKLDGEDNEPNVVFTTPSHMESLQSNSNFSIENASEFLSEKPDFKNSKVAACTEMDDNGKITIYICPELFINEINRASRKHWDKGISAAATILHEFWHYRQLTYLIEKGGVEMATDVLESENDFLYGDSLLESGAFEYGFSLGLIEQDLEEIEPVK